MSTEDAFPTSDKQASITRKLQGPHAGRALDPCDKPPPAYYDARPDGCWIWNRSKTTLGYGQTRYAGRFVSAHRAYYAHYVGAIAGGEVVMHSCDNPSCVNPEHLILATQRDNMLDKTAKGREGGTVANQLGEANANAKLTAEKVRAIRARLEDGVRQRDIAAEYGVSQVAICRINTGKDWAHV